MGPPGPIHQNWPGDPGGREYTIVLHIEMSFITKRISLGSNSAQLCRHQSVSNMYHLLSVNYSYTSFSQYHQYLLVDGRASSPLL